jgi:hypothetical protein
MDATLPFGFVTSCYAGDKFMVQATLASIQRYCPDVPVCLIADGDVDVGDLQEQYGLIVLRISDLPDARMQKLIGGSTRSKLAAIWEGPFEYFVWMDSDAIVWGDLTSEVRKDVDFHIFWSDPFSIEADAKDIPPWLPHFYFDPKKLARFDPGFEWRGLPYFCDGVFACRRNFVSFPEWAEVFGWREHPDSPWAKDFVCQPMINYLVHSKAQRGLINVARSDLQYLTRHVGRSEIDRETVECGWRLPVKVSRPRSVHFCGQKPFILNWRSYSFPFTLARLEHYRKKRGELGAWSAIWKEELAVLGKKLCARITRLVSRAQRVRCGIQ